MRTTLLRFRKPGFRRNFLATALPFLTCATLSSQAASWNAGTYSALTSAITSSSDGDTINLTNNIVVTAQVSLTKTLVIAGNNFTISVQMPGLTETGALASGASAHRVFDITGSGKTVRINNLSIIGGNVGANNGGAIQMVTGTTLVMNNSVVTRSRATVAGGIYNNGGVIYMNNTLVLRNAASYGGGFVNDPGGKAYLEKCTISENRSTHANGGGGGILNRGSGAFMCMNNSTVSNNKSTEIGAGMNNMSTAVAYLMNTSFTGNVACGDYDGGAIGNNNGTFHAINCLFAYNYNRSTGTTSNPTAFALDDMVPYAGASGIHLYYCITHAALPAGINNVIGNMAYTGLADGSDNTIFSGGVYTKVTDANSALEIGTAKVFQPFIYNNGQGIAPTLQTGSFTLQAGNKGTQVGYNNNNSSPVAGYLNRTTTTWVTLIGSGAGSHAVGDDQLGASRGTPPAVGNLEGATGTLYMMKVNTVTDGTVSGATMYGDPYPANTQVTLTAIPNAGKEFLRWDYVEGGTGTASTSNPYTHTLTQNTTLVPVYQTVAGGSYTITYAGNNNTGGEPPASGTFSAGTTIGGANTLQRTGYTFNGWNTAANGSGTAYMAGASYSAGTNLVLYAQWVPVPLPVTLVAFRAQKEEKSVTLRWETSNEQGVRYFQPERSRDGAVFSAVGMLVNAGSKTYAAQDAAPLSGTSYYRLKIVDADGSFAYSPVRTVMFGKEAAAVRIYPNPANDVILISGASAARVRMLSAETGAVTAACTLDAVGNARVETAGLANGLYFVQVTEADGKEVATQKVTVLR